MSDQVCSTGWPQCGAPAVAIAISRIGGVLVPVDQIASQAAQDRGDPPSDLPFLPQAAPRFFKCAEHAAWGDREFPNMIRVPLDTPEAEMQRLEALPYIPGARNSDPDYGDFHTWLSDGTMVRFFSDGVGWRWDTRTDEHMRDTQGIVGCGLDVSGHCTAIEDGRQAAAQATGVPAEMSAETFGAMMGWWWEGTKP